MSEKMKILRAVERVMGQATVESHPRNMTRAEAIAFYEAIAADCYQWVLTIRSESPMRNL